MNGNNTMRKSIQLISVIALIVAASGCAMQPTGGSKLAHQALMQQARNDNLIKICDQDGSKMSCAFEEREDVRKQLETLQESLRQ